MNMKFYSKLLVLAFVLGLGAKNLMAQNQGFYADTTKWPNSNSISVHIKSKGLSNVIGFQGSIKWDKNSLQWVSQSGNSSLGTSNFTFGTSAAVSQGVLTYIYSDVAANHTVPDGTDIITINFTIINNPVSTYSDNVVYFSNSPTTIGIDTAADVAGLSDLATLNSPNLERHTSGFVSFARPPVLTYSGGNVTDSITNRPSGCTYQWTVDGNNYAGTDISTFNNTPTGNVCLTITYPNSTSVSCLSSVLPVKFSSFTGKLNSDIVVLNWVTENEVNNKGFAVEKSFDGVNFTQTGFVNADASSSNQHAYSFNDVYSNKVTWYRLKQVDNNGKYAYSNVVKISSNLKDLINVYPNPTKGSVKIEGSKISKITVTSVLGKVVIKNEYAGVNNVTLNTQSLTKGMYLVSVSNSTETVVTKLIVE